MKKKTGDRRPETGIEVENRVLSHKLNEVVIKRIIRKILISIKKPHCAKLEVVFLDNNSIRSLNVKYKRRDRPTDVLSFKIDLKEFGSEKFLGEIFISPEIAFRNAKIYETRFEEELVRYIIHGILHLFGYEDESKVDKTRMFKRESEILEHLCEKENLSKVLITL